VETEYLAALSDELPISRWRTIVQKAVEDAEAGDWRAREWLTKQVLGPDLRTESVSRRAADRLFLLAVSEAAGISVDDQIDLGLHEQAEHRRLTGEL